jgi:hypothetical protein
MRILGGYKKNICAVMLEFSCSLGLKRKILFTHFRKMTKIAETLIMWTIWGMLHKLHKCAQKCKICGENNILHFPKNFRENFWYFC